MGIVESCGQEIGTLCVVDQYKGEKSGYRIGWVIVVANEEWNRSYQPKLCSIQEIITGKHLTTPSTGRRGDKICEKNITKSVITIIWSVQSKQNRDKKCDRQSIRRLR